MRLKYKGFVAMQQWVKRPVCRVFVARSETPFRITKCGAQPAPEGNFPDASLTNFSELTAVNQFAYWLH
jgi:hypothetical protein